MSREAVLEPQRLRPEGMRSRPVRMDPVFDDPEAVLALVRHAAPYQTMAAYMGYGAEGGLAGPPWFLTKTRADGLLAAPRWRAAACEAFGAQVVQPSHVVINLNGPSPVGPPHLDQPEYRGFGLAEAPLWLLMAMSRSRLFLPWLVPVASGLVWFWQGEGGDFEYWPDGPDAASALAGRPMWNTGVMSDNEAMWHRVGGFGPESQQRELERGLRAEALLGWSGGRWRILQEGGVLMDFAADEIRISLLWKALVFRDAAHLASFEDKRFDLDLQQVTDIFLADLAARGLRVRRPGDPANDPTWRALLEETYRIPFD